MIMKAYQREWCNRLLQATTKQEVLHICKKIDKDDTGGTDILCMVLARKVLENFK